ncbi:hypothetical protein QAD02_023391 [Eretmocerus hayati]|uniref:Uncharacterized protein n=1 Tax=Eretmocerus hayati TaxID=131215 RepID=A0ACC2PZ25_9HYME|nr:hypothetical protein QAD02_023391 [Eretmocerus hayati]
MWWPTETQRILLGLVCGVLLGLSLRHIRTTPWSERELMYLQFPGELFLRGVTCLVMPLVVSSIVSASSNLSRGSDSIGTKALIYYITTTTLGIALCVTLSQTIQPGKWGSSTTNLTDNGQKTHIKFVTTDTFLDLMRNLIPENIVQACLYQYQTVLVEPKQNESGEIPAYEMGITHRYSPGTNVLGLVFWGLLLGLALGSMPKKDRQPLQKFFYSLSAATAALVDYLIKAAPLGVMFLISGKIARATGYGSSGNDAELLQIKRLGLFVLTVFAGLALQALLVLPMLYFTATRRSPYSLMSKCYPALLTAFATSSSSATVPTTIRCLDKLGVDNDVSRFLAPIGATINMDGIALYESLGALFIMQMRQIELSLAQVVAVSITCTLSCIGAAGMPSGGYPMLIGVLNSLGIPAEDVALIIAVDSFVDRFRTMVNIVADCLGAGIISESVKKTDVQQADNEAAAMSKTYYPVTQDLEQIAKS